jgi:Asp-tRNA(Asn)/Glu-tRNA(Gln) amidotransferase A subunit family amidase
VTSRASFYDAPIGVIAAALQRGETTATELCDEAIRRRLGADLHPGPYIAWDPERARAEARLVDDWSRAGIALGPLHGIPISIKDVFGVAGYRTYAG